MPILLKIPLSIMENPDNSLLCQITSQEVVWGVQKVCFFENPTHWSHIKQKDFSKNLSVSHIWILERKLLNFEKNWFIFWKSPPPGKKSSKDPTKGFPLPIRIFWERNKKRDGMLGSLKKKAVTLSAKKIDSENSN